MTAEQVASPAEARPESRPLQPAKRRSRPLRIAILGTRGVPASYGGFETFAEELGSRLAARGHEVTVYGRSHWVPASRTTYRGIRSVRLPAPRWKYFETVIHAIFSAVHVAARRYDIVYVCNAANVPAVLVLMLTRQRVVLNVDGLEWRRAKWSRVGKMYLRACEAIAARLPVHVVTDARVIQEHYRSSYGRKVDFFPYGADLDRRAEGVDLSSFGLEPGQYVLYVSRLEPENNAHVVVDAYRSVRTDLPLAIVGDAPYATSYIAALRATDDVRVRFLGAVYGEGYRALQSGAVAYVQATEVGGTHPALVEAMGFSNAIVANDVPEHREVLGDAGRYYRTPAELATALQSVLDDRAVADRLRAAARLRAEALFDWDRVTGAYDDWFETLVHHGGGAR